MNIKIKDLVINNSMIYMQHKQKQRYYSLSVEQDLFDTWCLIRSFGSIVSHRGRIIKQLYNSEENAWYELTKVEYDKRQRGYVYADIENNYIASKSYTKIKKPKLVEKINKIVNPNQLDLDFF
ncbi:MAG: WGR domain-containing protein [Neisseriaceae bacterium]|jgi:predicted DNA-binding WGR domain protein